MSLYVRGSSSAIRFSIAGAVRSPHPPLVPRDDGPRAVHCCGGCTRTHRLSVFSSKLCATAAPCPGDGRADVRSKAYGRRQGGVGCAEDGAYRAVPYCHCPSHFETVEFIPIKSLVVTRSGAHGNYAGPSRFPSPDRGRPPSTAGCDLTGLPGAKVVRSIYQHL